MSEQATIAAETRTGYRPLYVWPALDDGQFSAVKEALPETLAGDGGHAAAETVLAHRLGARGLYSEVLIPREFFGAAPEGPQQLAWNSAFASALNYRELRYGHQRGRTAGRSRLFIGLSEELSPEEWQMCVDLKLIQPDKDIVGEPQGPVVNDDGSQTFEYVANPRVKRTRRLGYLEQSVMTKLAPQMGRIVASSVEVSLLPDIEIPSLYSDQLHTNWYE